MIITTEKLDLEEVNRELADKSPDEILRWAVDMFGSRLALQSSMQKTAGVLMHMITQISPETEIIFVDTGVHFPETLATRDEFISRFGANIKTYAPAKTMDEQQTEYGRHLYLSKDAEGAPGYETCCRLRKEVPFVNAVLGRFDAVAGGLMRAEGGARKDIPIVSYDPRIEAYKVYPLAMWTPEQVNEYTQKHNLPVHALYAQGFASIGCSTCTTPVKPGEDNRAGRWRHIREAAPEPMKSPLYCGINFSDIGKDI